MAWLIARSLQRENVLISALMGTFCLIMVIRNIEFLSPVPHELYGNSFYAHCLLHSIVQCLATFWASLGPNGFEKVE